MINRPILIVFLLALSSSLFGGSIYDDIKNNDLASLRRKIELLEMPLGSEPYLAYYLKNTDDFDPDMLSFLLVHGADPNLPDAEGVRPLHWAIWRFGPDEVAALLDKGADAGSLVDIKALCGSDGIELSCRLLTDGAEENLSLWSREGYAIFSAPAVAIVRGKPDILELFLEGLDLSMPAWSWPRADAPFPLFELPLWTLSYGYNYFNGSDELPLTGSQVRCFKALWLANFSKPESERVSLSPSYGGSVMATILDDLPALKKSLAQDMSNSIRYLPYAIVAGSQSTLDFLLRFNDLNVRSGIESTGLDTAFGRIEKGRRTPVYAYALLNGDPSMLTWFGDKGADLNASLDYARHVDNEWMNYREPALAASFRLALPDRIIEYILSKGVDLAAAQDSCPLSIAISRGREQMARALLDKGANPNLLAGGFAPIHFADVASTDLLAALLKKGANPNLPDQNGWTPLHWAVYAGKIENAKLLIASKANAALKTTSTVDEVAAGKTALDIAKLRQGSSDKDSEQKKFQEIIDWLKALPPSK